MYTIFLWWMSGVLILRGEIFHFKIQYRFLKISYENRINKTWRVQPFYLLRSALADTSSLSKDDTHRWFLRGAFFRGLMRLLSFLRVVESACFWRNVRRGGRNEGGDLLHRRSRQKNFAHVQRAMRGIFDVKVLFPRLVCSASKFQTSCLWNLTRASLAKATTRVRYVFRFRGIADACIGKFNEQKSLLEVFGIRW